MFCFGVGIKHSLSFKIILYIFLDIYLNLLLKEKSIIIQKYYYVLICNNCDFFYIGQTEELKQRTRKHKSDVNHPNNSNCKKCLEHLRICLKNERTIFQYLPVFV